MINLMQGDCLELMKNIQDGSVDLVLTDPPYGTMKGASLDGWENQTTEWDIAIEPKKIFEQISRILRPNGKAVLFSQEPYTSKLITSAIPSLPFCYRAIWYKNVHANALLAKNAMVNRYEDICVFSSILEENKIGNPIVEKMKKALKKSGKNVSEAIKIVGSSATHYFTSGKQFRIPTKEKFEKLRAFGFFNFEYEELKNEYEKYNAQNLRERNKRFPSVFNLWQGNKSKPNVLEYAKDNDGYHPTQKPVKLLEDLIKTFSNEGDIVLDFTMGSGSTGVACVNTNRNFIGMELDTQYFEISKKRIEEAQAQLKITV